MNKKDREEIARLEELEEKAIKECGDVDSIIIEKWALFEKIHLEAQDEKSTL